MSAALQHAQRGVALDIAAAAAAAAAAAIAPGQAGANAGIPCSRVNRGHHISKYGHRQGRRPRRSGGALLSDALTFATSGASASATSSSASPSFHSPTCAAPGRGGQLGASRYCCAKATLTAAEVESTHAEAVRVSCSTDLVDGDRRDADISVRHRLI